MDSENNNTRFQQLKSKANPYRAHKIRVATGMILIKIRGARQQAHLGRAKIADELLANDVRQNMREQGRHFFDSDWQKVLDGVEEWKTENPY